MRKRRPADDTRDPVMRAGICEKCLVFGEAIRRLNRHGAVDASRFQLRDQIVRSKRTPQRLQPGVALIRWHFHPGRLISAVGPKMLMGIPDETHRGLRRYGSLKQPMPPGYRRGETGGHEDNSKDHQHVRPSWSVSPR